MNALFNLMACPFVLAFLGISVVNVLLLVLTKGFAGNPNREFKLIGMAAAWIGAGIEAVYHNSAALGVTVPETVHTIGMVMLPLGMYYLFIKRSDSTNELELEDEDEEEIGTEGDLRTGKEA